MTQKTRTQIKTENGADFPDNSTHQVSPADLRGQMDDLADSAVFPEDISTGLYGAVDIKFAPAGGLAATTVQAALEELDAEKAPLADPALTGVPTAPTAAGGTNTTQVATTAFVAGATAALGLGTMAVQNANAVAVTGGTADALAITGSTFANASGANSVVQYTKPSAADDYIPISIRRDQTVGGIIAGAGSFIEFCPQNTAGGVRAAMIGGVNRAANNGTDLVFKTNVNGVAPAERGYFGSTGGFVVGSPTGGDKGPNTINATSLYQNGSQLNSMATQSASAVSISGGTILNTQITNSSGSNAVVNLSKAAAADDFVPLQITRTGTSTAGAVSLIDFSPNSNPLTRSAQLGGINRAGTNAVDLVFRTSVGSAAAVERGYFGSAGGFVVGTPTGGDKGAGTINSGPISVDAGVGVSPTALTLLGTDAGAGVGPFLTITRDSASPAASDTLGAIRWNGKDSANNATVYAQLIAQILDPTDTTEASRIYFQTVTAGTLATALIIGSGLTVVGGKLTAAASTTAAACLNLPVGAAPTSPVDGDIWREDNTNTGLKVRINGVTKTITVS